MLRAANNVKQHALEGGGPRFTQSLLAMLDNRGYVTSLGEWINVFSSTHEIKEKEILV